MRAYLRAGCLLFLVVGGLLPTALGQPEAYGVTPATLVVDNAVPGQAYERTVTLQNQLDSPSTITVEIQGESGAWVSSEPASGFIVPPRTNRDIRLVIQVPGTTGPGLAEGVVAFTTEPKSSGVGSPVRLSAAVRVNVSVGGEPLVAFAWGAVRAPHTDTARAPEGFAQVTNSGNVEATARLRATVSRVGNLDNLAQADGELRLRAGASGEVRLTYVEPLPVGEYVMHFAPQDGSGQDREAIFQVTVPGAPVGTLLAVLHDPRPIRGDLMRVDGRFRNDGTVEIRAAQLKAEVRDGGTILGVLESDPLVVPVGATVNLTAHWTPEKAGSFLLVGHVLYDGYLTSDNESPLNVQGPTGSGSVPGWIWLLVALLLAVAIVAFLLLRRRKREPADKSRRRPTPPPPGKRPPTPPSSEKHPSPSHPAPPAPSTPKPPRAPSPRPRRQPPRRKPRQPPPPPRSPPGRAPPRPPSRPPP